MNKKAQVFEEISPMGIIGGVIGGGIGLFITRRMGAGLILGLINFAVVGVVCYFIVAKATSD